MDIERLLNASSGEAKSILLELLMEAAIDSAGDNEKYLLKAVKETKTLHSVVSEIVDRGREDAEAKQYDSDLTDEKGAAWGDMLHSIEACVNILKTALDELPVGTEKNDQVD